MPFKCLKKRGGERVNFKKRLDYLKGDRRRYEAFKSAGVERRNFYKRYEENEAVVKSAIMRVSDIYYRFILYDFYIKGYTVSKIAERLGYSESHIKRLKKDAVAEVIKKSREK